MPFRSETGRECKGAGRGWGFGPCSGGNRHRFGQGFGQARRGRCADSGESRQFLEAQAGRLERRLQQIRERIGELDSKPDGNGPKQAD